MTLALLLTAVTGAWAEEKMVTINYSTMSSGAVTATGFYTIENFLFVGPKLATITTSEGVITKLVIKKYDGSFGDAFTEANVGVAPGTITYGSDEITVTDINAESVTLSRKGNYNWSTSSVDVYYGATAAYPFPITWDATNKTTGFSQPAGNVTMNVEYYPVAALTKAPAAKSDIQAATADAIVTAGTVAMIGQTENAQGTLMYYAVQSETAPDAPDYDNQNWSADVPTAADFNQGNVYVWYYVKGNDGDAESTFNDGAITKLGETGYVTLAAPPTYTITLAEGTEDAGKWTISQVEGLLGGETITATYSGSRKVKSVKAVKKAAAPAEGKTYTNLKGGEVLHVGDKFTETDGKYRFTHHENPQLSDYYSYLGSSITYEVLRADVVKDGYNYKYTESPNGQYYVLKYTYSDEGDLVTEYDFNQDLPVTGTSDGITVTLDGQDGSQRNLYTFWVHEPNQ